MTKKKYHCKYFKPYYYENQKDKDLLQKRTDYYYDWLINNTCLRDAETLETRSDWMAYQSIEYIKFENSYSFNYPRHKNIGHYLQFRYKFSFIISKRNIKIDMVRFIKKIELWIITKLINLIGILNSLKKGKKDGKEKKK